MFKFKNLLFTLIYFAVALFIMTKMPLGGAVVSAFFFSAFYWLVLEFLKEEDSKEEE